MIADPDVHNEDVSKRYTHDTIRNLSYYNGEKIVDLGFVGSCMVHKGDLKILSHMLRNLELVHGKVEFNAPLIVAVLLMSLRKKVIGMYCRNTLVLNLMMMHLRTLLVQNMKT